MINDFAVLVSSDLVDSFDGDQSKIATAALRAVNKIADRARTEAAKRIREQVNLPASYLNPSQGRLTVSKKAVDGDISAVVTGRQRPTSLARFATSAGAGVKVAVKPGLARLLPRAFFVQLRSGAEGLGNTGLAIRLPDGQRPSRAFHPTQLGANGPWLLYGPSVDQIFKAVSQDISPLMLDQLEAEFFRLMELN